MSPEEQDLVNDYEAAEAEMEAARVAFNEANEAETPDPHWQLKRDRFDQAMVRVRSLRAFWRAVGAAVPEEHPGHRSGIHVVNG